MRTKTKPARQNAILQNDLYINSKSRISVMQKRISQLLMKHKSVTLHGLGKTISKTCEIALRASKEKDLDLIVKTETVKLIDLISEPSCIDEEDTVEERLNSAIHITLTVKE
jgi:hypothetical protein